MTKSTKAKMRKGAWSPEARAKAAATRAITMARKANMVPNTQDAMAYLLKVESAIIKKYAKGAKRIEAADTLSMLALHALRGEI
jgi:hypothetical protein